MSRPALQVDYILSCDVLIKTSSCCSLVKSLELNSIARYRIVKLGYFYWIFHRIAQ